METEERTDIDLSGSAAAEEDVFADVPAEEDPGRITPAPPGVAEGSLGGEGATIGEGEPAVEGAPDEPETPSEAPAEEEQLPIDTGQGDPNEGDPNPVEEPGEPAPPAPARGHTGGSPEREYLILQEVEVNAKVAKELNLPVGSGVLYVPRAFGDGARKMKTIKARNAETALRAVGRLEEIGYDARVVAISAGFFQPRRVRNKPREGAEVEIGGE